MTPDATPTPPSPEPPREREGETGECLWCGRLIHGTFSFCSSECREEHRTHVVASLPPSAEAREPEPMRAEHPPEEPK